MRTFLLGILLCVFDLAFGVNYPPTYYIPAGGQTINNLSLFQVASQTFYVTTSGSVNLGSNTYTLTYASLPSANTTWNVIFDASNLTLATATNVNLFGETPLATYSPTKKFYINFSVVWDAGVPSKKVTYFASLNDLKTFIGTTTFNGRVNFNDTVEFYSTTIFKPTSAITTGQTVTSLDTTGKLGYGCAPWCILGNAGLNSATNFLGTTDTVALRFRVNNVASGLIDYNLLNTGLGYQTLVANTSGVGSSAFGYWALKANTTGIGNTALGQGALVANLSGSQNTAVGENSLQANTTGVHNTAIGDNSLQTPTTGGSNIAVGYGADAATSSTTKAIAIGSGAVASSNQLAIAGVRSISIPQMSSGVNYTLVDTSGTGDFVSRVSPVYQQTTFTPLTSDSINITTQNNLINPAGTIAVLTIKFPAAPQGGQLLEFSTTQTITSLLWSTANNQTNVADSHLVSTLAAGATTRIMFNSTNSKWYNW